MATGDGGGVLDRQVTTDSTTPDLPSADQSSALDQQGGLDQQVTQDQTKPDQAAPDLWSPDQTAKPDLSVSQDQAAPDQAAPDAKAPDQAAPDQAAPDQAAPDQQAASDLGKGKVPGLLRLHRQRQERHLQGGGGAQRQGDLCLQGIPPAHRGRVGVCLSGGDADSALQRRHLQLPRRGRQR